MKLQKLSGAQINALYATLASRARRMARKASRRAPIRHVHAVLHRALKDAVRWERLSRNPIEAADPPRICGNGRGS